MSGTVHVFDFVADVSKFEFGTICPLFGSERFLQQLGTDAIKASIGDDAEFSVVFLEGDQCEWSDVQDHLLTRSLFSAGDEQFVVVDAADNFIKKFRDRLESLLDQDSDGTLILVVDSWPSNTKLFKRINKTGLQVHCDAPVIKRGRGKQRDDAKIFRWLIERANSKYEYALSNPAAAVLVELTECSFGRMEQELCKISLYAEPDQELSPIQVREIVGGWPAQTMWSAVDAALDGRAGHALDLLHKLFLAGEHPLAMFGQISWSIRRYAEVGELVTRDRRLGRRIDLGNSLKTAGFRPWGNEIDNASRRLKQLGRSRVGKIMDRIVATDFALKRTHSKEERGRLMLELLFTSMSEQLSPAKN